MSSQVAFGIVPTTLPAFGYGSGPLCGPLAPLASDWAALNDTVEGRLHFGHPWAKPCFSIYNGNKVQPNYEECAHVQDNFFNNHLNRSHAFGGYASTQFEACMATEESCLLDWTNAKNPSSFSTPQQCSQGSISPFYIDVRKKEDVMAAFQFSKEKGVTLTIKNTGHDFQGRSSAPDSLGLWMHNLKYIKHEPEFVAEGCDVEGQSAVTFGAGSQFHDLIEFAEAHGLQVVAGSDQSVGAAGGWAQGGGHSPLTPNYGLGADRTLQYKVVTPDGVFRTVNKCQNEDLFFALRGGGGATFGVVLEATMMASPRQSFRMANINWPPNNNNLREVLEIFLNNVTTFAKQGFGGYLTPTIGNLVLISPVPDLDEAQDLFKPLVELTTKMDGKSSVAEIASLHEWFQGWVDGRNGEQDPVGLPVALSSRFVPAKNHETESGRAELKEALMNAFAHSAFSQIHITTAYGFKGSKGLDTSVHPSWRTALYQVIFVNSWYWDGTMADQQLAYTESTKAADYLREITPGAGAYLNEADIHEPNFEESFWGDHYPRLLEIKKKYDPDHLLDCWHCVGWKGPQEPQYKCYI
ncbi:FAD-binding domain-containing protein [Agrocybe pediades]|nr:FAD-binding domain-containing protein [Agrocybe pediades]